MYRVSPCFKTQIFVTRPQCVNTVVLLRMNTGLLETCRGFK